VKSKTSQRIILEPLMAAHAAELYEALSDPAIYAYISGPPPESISMLTERYRRLESRVSSNGLEQWLNWVIRRIEDRQCIGYVQATIYPGNTADFAFVLAPPFWGLGLAHEASEIALTALFAEFRVATAFATVDKRNTRSCALLSRLGFQRVAAATYPHGEVASGDRVYRLTSPTRAATAGAD
jgi:RimJ/RimL family protein N-acetyltransferase